MEIGVRIEETFLKMSNRSQRAGFVPQGWMRAHKLQFLFYSFFFSFFPPLRKEKQGAWELQMCNRDLSNEVGFFCS